MGFVNIYCFYSLLQQIKVEPKKVLWYGFSKTHLRASPHLITTHFSLDVMMGLASRQRLRDNVLELRFNDKQKYEQF